MSRFTVYNNIVSQEKYSKVNPENSQLGEDFLEYLQSIDRSYIQDILDDEKQFENYKPIIRKIENPAKTVRREKTILTDEQVDGLLDTLVERKEYECACAIAIAAYSGMRHGELLQMRPVFFNDDHFVYDSMWKTDKVRAKGHGKDGLQLNKFVLYGAKKYIDLWINEREIRGIDSEWLYIIKWK